MDHELVQFLAMGTGVLTAGLSIAGFVWWKRKVDAAWGRVAARLGMEVQKRGWGQRAIAGKVGGHFLVIDTFTRGSGKNAQTYTRFTLEGRGAFHPGLELKAESTWEGLKKVFAGEDVHLDDATFDAAVNVQGPEDELLAALDERARMAVLKLVSRRCQVKDGKILFETAGVLRDPARMVALAQTLVAAADALRVPSVVHALQRNAKEDSNPGVRRRNLAALAMKYLDRQEARQALEDALSDPSAELRLYAASVLRTGPRVREVLDKLFDEARTLTDAQRGQVLQLLVECFPYETVAGRVAKALDLPSTAMRVAAVTAVGKARDSAPLLARPELAITTEAELGIALADALGRCAGAEGEKMLLDLLQSDAVAVKAAAAKALGLVGTVRSVEPLLPFTQGLFADGALKDAAREAIRGIQSRLGEAQAGGLSVVDGRAGEGGLSVPSLPSGTKERGN